MAAEPFVMLCVCVGGGTEDGGRRFLMAMMMVE
jgi:hypothetical protein